MKIEFARDDEIDAANLARRTQMIASHEGDGYEGDAAFTNSVREEVNQDQSLFRPIDSRDHLVKMFVFLPEDKSAAVMRASAVFDTTPEECVAMETEKESRAIMKKDEYLEKSILHLNAHSYVPPPPPPLYLQYLTILLRSCTGMFITLSSIWASLASRPASS